MDILDRDALITLARPSGWPSVSLYLPTHRTTADKEPDRLRLKNLIKVACDALVDGGMRETAADVMLSPAQTLLGDDTFWRDASDGLAIFITPTETHTFRLDVAMPEQAVVGDRFYVRPLAIAYRGDEQFYALALGMKGSRLFHGGHFSIEQVPLPDAPESLADELKYDDDTEDQLQGTTFASPESKNGSGRTIAMFHGHGGEKDVRKDGLVRYLRHIERVLGRTLDPDAGIPLLLLGVGSVIATYRELNTYPALVAEQVLGAVDELTPHQIHARALAALGPRFKTALAADLAELAEKGDAALVSNDPTEIVEAAAAGRVKTLFLDQGTGPFGRFDRDSFRAFADCPEVPRFLRDTALPADMPDGACGWDLVDLAVAETALHGGAIHAFAGEATPVRGVAAVFRY